MVARLVLLLCLALFPGGLLAQTISWNEMYWNPQPMDGDVVLPLRCGGAVVFRRVDTTSADSWLADTEIQLGNTNVRGQEHSEYAVPTGLAGGLTAGGAADRYYLIGKYEISSDQYRAMMEDTCPVPSDAGSVPMDGLPWFDAVEFTAAYTTWLYANAPDALRAAAGERAFLRLPTEAEWEFAARGGLAVNEGDRRAALFQMDGPLEDFAWFSGFKSCDGLTQPIGLLKPNPLGLFDVLGNVQEMTLDTYRLRTRERFHGQVGGIAGRGGSCLTLENRVRISERDEVPLFDAATGTKAGRPYTGFRVAIGAPVLRSEQQIASINESWKGLTDTRIAIDPADDPIATLGRIAEAQQDVAVGDAIDRARELFEREMERRNVIETKSAKAIILGGYLAARSFIIDYNDLDSITAYLDREGATLDPVDRRVLEGNAQRTEERLEISEAVLMNAIVQSTEIFSRDVFYSACRIVRNELRLQTDQMTPRTQASTGRLLDYFVDFTETYRRERDTAPEEFLADLIAYFEELIGGRPPNNQEMDNECT